MRSQATFRKNPITLLRVCSKDPYQRSVFSSTRLQYLQCRGHGRRRVPRPGSHLRAYLSDHPARGYPCADDHRLFDRRIGDQVCVCLSMSFSGNRRRGACASAVVPRHGKLITLKARELERWKSWAQGNQPSPLTTATRALMLASGE